MKIIPWRQDNTALTSSAEFQDLWNRFWGNGHGEFASHLPEVFRDRPFPSINIAETEESYSITMDCPGLDEKDIQVETMGSHLVISGERKWEDEKKGKEFRRVESQYGKFERTVALPENVRTDPTKIIAKYKKGVLTVTVPKVEKTPNAKIPVKAG